MLPKSREWQRARMRIRIRDDWKCVKCGMPGRLEVDHIVPRENGGSHDDDNLQTLCRGCHIEKTRQERNKKTADRYVPGYEGPHQGDDAMIDKQKIELRMSELRQSINKFEADGDPEEFKKYKKEYDDCETQFAVGPRPRGHEDPAGSCRGSTGAHRFS